MSAGITLVGDAIENPANALTMIHAAGMFGAECRFRDTKELAGSEMLAACALELVTGPEIQAGYSKIIACDNLPGATQVYGFNPGKEFALLVGNERRGLSHEIRTLATGCVEVPMHSRRINCLNVAAASAVALYYLSATRVGSMAIRSNPAARRPDVLLVAPSNHFELGSTLRSLAGLGWERAFIEDSHSVWFTAERAVRAEARAAARRGRNDLLLVPCASQSSYAYPVVTVVSRRRPGRPLHRMNLAGGPRQLVVIADETSGDFDPETAQRFGEQVQMAHLEIPVADFNYHYRLIATIVLAEIARQVGRRPAAKFPQVARPPIYEHALKAVAEVAGQIVSVEDLLKY